MNLRNFRVSWSPYLGLITAIILGALLVWRGLRRDTSDFTHEQSPSNEILSKSGLSFVENSEV